MEAARGLSSVYLDIISFLLQKKCEGADDEAIERSFYIACYNGNIDIVKLLYSKLITKNKIINNGIIYATHSNNLEIFKFLIEMGADVNARDTNGKDVLTYACSFFDNNKMEVVNLLLDRGAKTFHYDQEYQNSPFYYAVNHTSSTLLKFLLQYGVNMNMKGTINPVEHALSIGNLEAASLFIKNGANVGDAANLLKNYLLVQHNKDLMVSILK